MSRPVRFKTAAIGELLKQLRFASPDVRLKQMRAAEQLAREIDPERTYPDEFIMYRVTGYRPDSADTGAILFGAALVGDLAQLVTELSKDLSIGADDARPAISLDELAKRWGVSLKSVSRYRHRGLVCHMLMLDGSPQMACYVDEAERFAAAHPHLLRKASAFRRIDAATVHAIVDEARALRKSHGMSLNRAARVLAAKHHRSLEAVRGVLQRHDAQADSPIFTDPGPLTERQRRVAYRAWRMGMTPRALGKRFGKSMQTIHRAVYAQRLAQLAAMPITFVALPTFEHADAEDVILSPASVRTGLQADERFHDALTLIAACKAAGASELDEMVLDQRVAAYHWLKRRAVQRMSPRGTWPTAGVVDDIETSLRWATRLKRTLVDAALPAAIRAVELALHRPLTELPSQAMRSLVDVAVRTTAEAIESFDPVRGTSLDRVVGFAVGRAMARQRVSDRAGRAAARHAGEKISTAELFEQLNPWQALLDVPWRWRGQVANVRPEARAVVELAYGLAGEAPVTLSVAAKRLGMTRSRAAQVAHAAVVELRRLAAARG